MNNAKTPPPYWTGSDNKGGGGVLAFWDPAAGENVEVLASFFIDFPLEIVFWVV